MRKKPKSPIKDNFFIKTEFLKILTITIFTCAVSNVALSEGFNYSLMDGAQLIRAAKDQNIIVTVTDNNSITIYPIDKNQDLTRAILEKSDDVARVLSPDKWLTKALIGTWKCPKNEETTIAKFRGDGVVEIIREHKNKWLGLLNSAINGTIYYNWAVKDAQIYSQLNNSDRKIMDYTYFLSKAKISDLKIIDKDHIIAVNGDNAVGLGDWYRIGY